MQNSINHVIRIYEIYVCVRVCVRVCVSTSSKHWKEKQFTDTRLWALITSPLCCLTSFHSTMKMNYVYNQEQREQIHYIYKTFKVNGRNLN